MENEFQINKKSNIKINEFNNSKAHKIHLILLSFTKKEMNKREIFNDNVSISKRQSLNKSKSKEIIIEHNTNVLNNVENTHHDDSEEDSSDMSCEEEIII